MVNSRRSGSVFFAAVALCSGFASAATNPIEFRSDSPHYSLLPGQTASIMLLLAETNAGNPYLLTSEQGLVSAGIQINRVPNTLPISPPAAPAFISNLASDPAFNDAVLTPLITVNPPQATLLEFVPAGVHGALPFTIDASTIAVPVGVVSITAGSFPGDVTTFSLSDRSAGSDTLSFLQNLVLDPVSTTSFTVTVTPEPASAALLLFGSALLCADPAADLPRRQRLGLEPGVRKNISTKARHVAKQSPPATVNHSPQIVWH